MEFGQYLRALRRTRHMSQRDLASRTQVDFTYISKIESGTTPPPSVATLRLIAHALEVDAAELIYRAGKVPSGFPTATKENPLLSRILWKLSEQPYPETIYQDILTLLK